jgi:hypothetical protein
VRESRTPGSARGGRGDPVPYRHIVKSGARDASPGVDFRGSVANFLGGHATSKDVKGFIPLTNRTAEPDTFRLSFATGVCGSCA